MSKKSRRDRKLLREQAARSKPLTTSSLEYRIETIGKDGHPDNERETARVVVPISSTQAQVPIETEDDTKASNSKFRFQWNWWRIIEFCGIAAAVWYAIITYNMWRDLRKNFSVDQRAWLEVKVINSNATLKDFSYAGFPIQVINVGKTPARNIKIVTAGAILSRTERPSLDYRGPSVTSTTGVLFPNIPDDVVGGVTLTESQRTYLSSGDGYIAQWANITWVDIFGTEHWTHFCAYRVFTVPNFAYAADCTAYNDTDNNPPK